MLVYSFEKCDEFNDVFFLCELNIDRNGDNEWKMQVIGMILMEMTVM